MMFSTKMTTRILRSFLPNSVIKNRCICTNNSLLSEKDNENVLEKIRSGYNQFLTECKSYKNETFDIFRKDFDCMYYTDKPKIQWQFNGKSETLDKWIVSCDSDHNQGFSSAKLELSEHGTGIFSGVLSTQVPKDGRIKYAGFCNLSTAPLMKAFKKKYYLDWAGYTHLALRVRGDGRQYLVNLHYDKFFDVFEFDAHHYVLYTRGGPHWQYVQIPFSKFCHTNKGQLRDDAEPIALSRIKGFGITMCDKINGPFRLEIDYIGIIHSLTHTEETAYETYAD